MINIFYGSMNVIFVFIIFLPKQILCTAFQLLLTFRRNSSITSRFAMSAWLVDAPKAVARVGFMRIYHFPLDYGCHDILVIYSYYMSIENSIIWGPIDK